MSAVPVRILFLQFAHLTTIMVDEDEFDTLEAPPTLALLERWCKGVGCRAGPCNDRDTGPLGDE
jgi:hypothetical protein